jgi:type IV pilus assembly protein PilE
MLIRSSKQRGFTLIELMITVAIVGILAAVAYPSYTNYVKRGYRAEGTAQLSDATARIERYYAQNNSYDIGTDLSKIGLVSASATGKYSLTVASSANSYTFSVAPQGPQATDTCGTMTVNQAGARTPDPSTTTCWK